MKNEIEIKNGYIIKKSIENNIDSVVKPLLKEIYLFSTYISGINNIDINIIKSIKIGDKLNLKREINKFDDLAILISKDNMKIGYIPEEDNIIFSRLMDAGKMLNAKVESINFKDNYYNVYINIYLIDV